MCSLHNSEVLFLYEAKLCNPNGDPDEENRPRMDPKTFRNLVSDVRLKRYIRDYIIDRFGEKYVWVSTLKGENVASDERGMSLSDQWKGDSRLPKGVTKDAVDKWINLVPKLCIDARFFGATVAIRARGKTKGESRNFIGPVQFAWGFSLHPVDLVDSSTITSIFMGREARGKQGSEGTRYGTMGKDWRVHYSLIAFYGIVSGARAKRTGLREADVKLLDNLLWAALLLEPVSRSKIGQYPHLYLRVEYKDAETMQGDLRRYLMCETKTKNVRDHQDLSLSYAPLLAALKTVKNKISHIYIHENEDLQWIEEKNLLQALQEDSKLKGLVTILPHSTLKVEEILAIP